MMGSVSVFLMAQLILSVMYTQGKPSPCHKRRKTVTNSFEFKRLSPEEELKRAFELYPKWNSCCVSPWEMSNQFEGDLMVKDRKHMRTVLRDPERKWPTRDIPYRIREPYFYDHEIELIHSVIKEFNGFTCVTFRNATDSDTDYVLITGKYEGCVTAIGREGGAQPLNLEPPVCIAKKGGIFHELLHAAGFTHEHNSPIRDKYIRIHRAHIKKGKEAYFEKYTPDIATDYGYAYDYNSIMHGGRQAYSVNGSSTIEPIDEFAFIGHKQKLSPTDILKVHRHFNC